MNTTPGQSKYPSGRLISLDVFRGFTMMSMVLVNNAGDWENVYAPFRHAEWNGCTFTDLIFPFFLFIVGVSMSFSFAKRLGVSESRSPLVRHIIRRTLILFGLGLFLNWFPDFNILEARIPGVLQRIAICHFVVSWMAIGLSPRGQYGAALGLLAVYWIGLLYVPVPGHGAGVLEPVGNFGWWTDNLVLAGHTWQYAPAEGFDPEGVWSTLPAIVTTLLGYFTGRWLRSDRDQKSKLIGLFVGGNTCLLLGYVLTIWMPYNKNLWTVSYVFHTAGFALQFLAMFFFIVDVKGYRRFATPFLVFGSNAIFVYFFSSAGAGLLYSIPIGAGEAEVSLTTWLYQTLFQPWASLMNASLAFAVAYVLVWLGVAYLLYRKGIFLKV